MRFALLLFICLVAGGGAYALYHFSAEQKHYRLMERSLQSFGDATATRQSYSIRRNLETLIGDRAKIHLEMRRTMLVQQSVNPLFTEDDDKQGFINFTLSLLPSFSDFGFRPELDRFIWHKENSTADVNFSGQAWADAVGDYGGTPIDMRDTLQTECSGSVHFSADEAVFDSVHCQMQLLSLPKPGQQSKLRGNPEMMHQLLR
jgi:hypothetical protein